mmetsp:Transcript_3774/g.11954  ORF Transcript_3774/g.11954 Transcript_3774/m.11954 type:complete len:281 (-) Transcript_3774:854-1696(-)
MSRCNLRPVNLRRPSAQARASAAFSSPPTSLRRHPQLQDGNRYGRARSRWPRAALTATTKRRASRLIYRPLSSATPPGLRTSCWTDCNSWDPRSSPSPPGPMPPVRGRPKAAPGRVSISRAAALLSRAEKRRWTRSLRRSRRSWLRLSHAWNASIFRRCRHAWSTTASRRGRSPSTRRCRISSPPRLRLQAIAVTTAVSLPCSLQQGTTHERCARSSRARLQAVTRRGQQPGQHPRRRRRASTHRRSRERRRRTKPPQRSAPPVGTPATPSPQSTLLTRR